MDRRAFPLAAAHRHQARTGGAPDAAHLEPERGAKRQPSRCPNVSGPAEPDAPAAQGRTPSLALTVPTGSAQVGQQVVYEIKFTNQGKKVMQDVVVTASFPPALPPVKAEGPTGHHLENQRVVFEALASLEPQAQAIYRVQAHALLSGPQRVKLRVNSPSLPEPLEAEGETQILSNSATETKAGVSRPATPPRP